MLNGGFTRHGYLFINRGSGSKELEVLQHCPHRNDKFTQCGEWCPRMGDPAPGKVEGEPVVQLEICDDIELTFNEFEDRRTGDRRPPKGGEFNGNR